MRFTAIALDYDGTIALNGHVPRHVLDGLRRLKESGRTLLLVTGRQLEELLGRKTTDLPAEFRRETREFRPDEHVVELRRETAPVG